MCQTESEFSPLARSQISFSTWSTMATTLKRSPLADMAPLSICLPPMGRYNVDTFAIVDIKDSLATKLSPLATLPLLSPISKMIFGICKWRHLSSDSKCRHCRQKYWPMAIAIVAIGDVIFDNGAGSTLFSVVNGNISLLSAMARIPIRFETSA